MKPWNHETPVLTSHDTKRETFSLLDYAGRGERFIGFAMQYNASEKYPSPIQLQLPSLIEVIPGSTSIPPAGWILGAWDSDSHRWDVAVNLHPSVAGARTLAIGLKAPPESTISFASSESHVTQRPLIFGGFNKVLKEASKYNMNEDIMDAQDLHPNVLRNSQYPKFSGYN